MFSMQWFRQVQVGTRLGALTLMSVLATMLAAAVGLWSAGRLTTLGAEVIQSKDMVADVLPPPLYLIEARLVVSQAVEGLMSPPEARRELERLASEHDARERYWRANPVDGVPAHLLSAQYDTAHRFITAAHALLDDSLRGDSAERGERMRQLHALYLEHRGAVDKTVQVSSALAERAIGDLTAVIATSRHLLWVTLIVTPLSIGLLSLLVARSILLPLRESIRSVRHVANGDLSRPVELQGRDELNELQQALHDMQTSLSGIVRAVRANADGVATASTQISEGNNDLCSRTEAQASALQQTAATLEELGVTVQGNAEQAREASLVAIGAREVAEEGGRLMAEVVQTMGGISDSSRRIGDIVGVINDIAFQTNILALNAAVEAARAGAQGRGFAVVAAEVRTLSQRTAQSAREITQLIETCTARVDGGARLVQGAGQTMQRIVDAIRDVNATVLQISSASSEQSEGVLQVGATVSRLDENTQRNAALVVQSAAAADSLRLESARLVEMVQSFTLSAEH